MVGLVRRVGWTVILASVAGLLATCSGTTRSFDEPAPPAAAPPAAVARVYLRAAFTGDCALTSVLTTSNTWSWCDNPRLLAYRTVGRADRVPASMAGRNEECVSFQMDTHGSSDGSLPAGWQPWSLCFVRTPAGWRVYDQGQG